jgi:hypothetical protein
MYRPSPFDERLFLAQSRIRLPQPEENAMAEDPTITGLLLTFSSPVAGREAEYDDWYQNTHLPQLCTIPGIRSAQRFRLVDDRDETAGRRNVAVYQLDGDPQAVFADMSNRARSGELDMTTSIDQTSIRVELWTSHGQPVTR